MAVDYDDWLQWELWSLETAVLLLHGVDPDTAEGEALKKLCKSNIKPRPKIAREVKATFYKANSAIRVGNLPHWGGHVAPLVFLRWAKGKNFALPENLDNFLDLHPEDTKPQLENSLTETERNSLLKMILGMAKARYGYDSKNPRNPATGGNKDSIYADLAKYELDILKTVIA
jgi:hypothetical protein